MSRIPSRFRQSDLARALKAVKQAQVNMSVEIAPDGTIRIIPTDQKANQSIESNREIIL